MGGSTIISIGVREENGQIGDTPHNLLKNNGYKAMIVIQKHLIDTSGCFVIQWTHVVTEYCFRDLRLPWLIDQSIISTGDDALCFKIKIIHLIGISKPI